MPANKRSARRSKSFKKCSRQGRPGCSRKKKSCTWNSRRKPRCQPKGSRKKSTRKKSARKVSKKASTTSTLGGLMDKSEIEANNKARKCAGSTDVTDPNGCAEDCTYDKKLKRCIPEDPVVDPSTSFGKFMDGKKYLTFRSNKKPAFSFRIPINADTLFGKYSGAIRFAPSTGKLHLCYGPLSDLRPKQQVGANRPVLSMLVKPKLSENLWTWYLSSGKNLQKKRMRELAEEANVLYTDIYALPGASYQLSYTEANFLEATCHDITAKMSSGDLPFGLKPDDVSSDFTMLHLVNAPTTCPSVLNGTLSVDSSTGCLESLEFGGKGMDDLSDDEDYNQLAVLGHAPNKKQKELVSDNSHEEKTDKKTTKKAKKVKDVVRSPMPERFKSKLADINTVLTASLAKERVKAFETKADLGPDARVLQNEFVIEMPTSNSSTKVAFLKNGYHQTKMFAEVNKLISMWNDRVSVMNFEKPDMDTEHRELLQGMGELNYMSTVPNGKSDLGGFYQMNTYVAKTQARGARGARGARIAENADDAEDALATTGVASVIEYLTNAIPNSRVPVFEVHDKSITATSIPLDEAETREFLEGNTSASPPRHKQYAMDFVQRLLLLNLWYLSHKTNSLDGRAPGLIKCSFIVSICLAWLKAFDKIYKPRDGTSMALTMPRTKFALFARAARAEEEDKQKVPIDAKVVQEWPARVALFPLSGMIDSSGKVASVEAVYAHTKTTLEYLTRPDFQKLTMNTMGSAGLIPPYDVVSMLKSAYKLSDARCESMLLELDTQPSQAYRSAKNNVSRRARARARQYLSESGSSSSDSDSD